MRAQTRRHGSAAGHRRQSTGRVETCWAAAGLFIALVTAGAGCGGGGGAAPADGGSGGAVTEVGGSGGTIGNNDAPGSDGPGGDGPVLTAANLGKPCTATAACGVGLICLLPTDSAIFGSGGPANGYCTANCADPGVPAACGRANGTCTNMGIDMNTPQIYCLKNCVRGAAGGAGKCLGRTEVACSRLPAAADGGAPRDVCLPTCSQDKDCPTGRVCDEAAAVCVAAQRAGTPMGTHCEPAAMPGTCAGSCLSIGSGAMLAGAFCSRRCVYGQLMGCNWVGTGMSLATGGAHGVCALGTGDADTGDQGFCAQVCDSVSDCTNRADPGLTCDLAAMAAVEHGVCFFAGGGADGGTDASDGRADQAPGN